MDKKFNVNQIRVASPCSVPWERMSGDDKTRHCHSCNMKIYNIAEMTQGEIKTLAAQREGKICARLYRRADGKVLTRDCPVGLRNLQKRVARFAGATLTLVFSLWTGVFAQSPANKNSSSINANSKLEQTNEQASIAGIVLDQQGAVIPSVELKLINEKTKKRIKVRSDAGGNFIFKSLASGAYIIEAKANGFNKYRMENIEIKSIEVKLEIVLQPAGESVTVGLIFEDPLIDVTSSSVTTRISQKDIEKLPH